MPENEGGNSAQDIVQKVQKKGDTLDPIKRLTGKPRPGSLATALSLSLPLGVEAVASKEGLNYLLTYPGYSAFAGTLLGAIYGYGRLKEKKGWSLQDNGGTSGAEKVQEEFRELVGEPVDLIRTRKNLLQKKGPVVLRWYGLDGLDATSINSASIGTRLESLVEIAELSGIKDIVMGSSALNELLQEGGSDHSVSEYGKIVASAEFLSDAKKMPKRIIDKKADPNVLVSSLDQAKKLLEKLEGEGDLYQSLESMVNDSQVSILLNAWRNEQTHDNSVKLQNVLGNVITNSLSDKEGSSSFDRMAMKRSNQFFAIKDGFVSIRNVAITGDESSIDPSRSVYSFVNIPHGKIDLLVKSIFPKKKKDVPKEETQAEESAKKGPLPVPDRELRSVIALYELARLHIKDDEIEKMVEDLDLNVGNANASIGDKRDTLYQRLRKEPPRTVPFLRRRAKVKKDESTLEYRNKKRMRRYLAAGLLTVAIGGASWETGNAGRLHYNSLYGASIDSVGEPTSRNLTDYFAKVEKRIHEDNPWYSSLAFDVVDKLQTKQLDIEEATVVAALDAGIPVNVLKEIVNYSFLVDGEWINKAKRFDIPSDLATQSWDFKGETGDIPIGRNEELYHVTPLSDQSAEGYWFTELYDGITTAGANTNYPFKDAGINYTVRDPGKRNLVDVPHDPKRVKEKLLFMVSTPYFEGEVIAPIKSGTKIAAARIVDTSHPEVSIPVDVTRDSRSGLYRIYSSPEDDQLSQIFSNMELPKLEYYLAESPKDIIKAKGDIEYEVSNVEQPMRWDKKKGVTLGGKIDEDKYQKISPADVARVRVALGLSPTATEADIRNAVKSKKYSLTPLADAGKLANKNAAGRNGGAALTDIAVEDALLPSEVCNTATVVGAFATGGEGNVASGFRLKEKGEFSLSEGRRHMFGVLSDGTIRDYTPKGEDKRIPPVSPPKVEENPGDQLQNNLNTAGKIGLAGAGIALLYNRRRNLMQVIEKAKEIYFNEKIFDPDMLSTVSVLLFTQDGKLSADRVTKLIKSRDEHEIGAEKQMKMLLQLYPNGLTDEEWDQLKEKAAEKLDPELLHKGEIISYLNRLQRDWAMIHDYLLTEERDLVKT